VEHPNAVAIVALREERPGDPTAEPLVALVRLRRPAVGGELWEIPAGLVELGERDEPQRTAERELREETGATAARWKLLTREYPSPGFSTESIGIYLATGIELPPTAGPMDHGEIAEARWVPFSEALAMCSSGAIRDGKTLLGLMLARDTLTLSPAALGGAHTMPLDPTNAPFSRSARYRDPADLALEGLGSETGASPGAGQLDTSLKLQDMLLEEFNYASVTAYQAMEDRARMFNLYLIVIGVVASALGVLFQFGKGERAFTVPLSAIALVVAGLLGVVFFVKLIRVRQAYNGSTLAMSVIKEFYLIQFAKSMPQAKYAFWWRLSSLPKGERFGSITFVVSMTVAVLNGLCFGAAAFIAYQTWLPGSLGILPETAQPFLVAAVVAVVLTLLHIPYFRSATNNQKGINSAQQHLARMREEMGVSVQDITVAR
jgi:ADP-ribose pyrophosphatase